MPFEKGQGGRPKGAVIRVTASLKYAFEQVYLDLQENTDRPYEHLLAWAEEHPSDFYKICARLIPRSTTHSFETEPELRELTDAQLQAIILDDEETRKLLKIDRYNLARLMTMR